MGKMKAIIAFLGDFAVLDECALTSCIFDRGCRGSGNAAGSHEQECAKVAMSAGSFVLPKTNSVRSSHVLRFDVGRKLKILSLAFVCASGNKPCI